MNVTAGKTIVIVIYQKEPFGYYVKPTGYLLILGFYSVIYPCARSCSAFGAKHRSTPCSSDGCPEQYQSSLFSASKGPTSNPACSDPWPERRSEHVCCP